MAGMRCDSCGEMLGYREEIAVTSREDGALTVGLATESAFAVEDGQEPEGKYHVRCYVEMTRREPEQFPPLFLR